jgi:hypothetical protein
MTFLIMGIISYATFPLSLLKEDARDCQKAGFVFIITQSLSADWNEVTYKEAKCSLSRLARDENTDG